MLMSIPFTISLHTLDTHAITITWHTKYNVPPSTADYHKFSFFPRTVVQWNTLPSYVVSADTIPGFKSVLSTSVFLP
ncbi:hypothetical protein DPMN_126310 [Dreissena polymorpha]|uniref:Uncharacterized protein n=1 Tax=Dreissena polymorpha TaxID=45954 RepID=A0A9D4GZW6_DREPO|nr:hypothetical protein DPMN_162460 [Dreissena polymorpha]KAH3824474.1 hypothetical protein DPMN_126310 [Dreissena polymorpha]